MNYHNLEALQFNKWNHERHILFLGTEVINLSMGAGASTTGGRGEVPPSIPLRRLPEAIEEAIYVHEKFPLVVDTTEQAARYWKLIQYELNSLIFASDLQILKISTRVFL